MDSRYNQHDDRTGGPQRRGGHRGGRSRYSRGGRGGYSRGGRGREVNPRSRFEDDSEMWDEGATGGQRPRFEPYSKNRSPNDGGSVFKRLGGSVFKHLSGMGPKGGGGTRSWHKVTVLNAAEENKEWLKRQLSSQISEKFQPVGEHVLGDKFMFFIAESGAAMELKQLGTIESRNGTFQVLVKPSGPPRESRGGGNTERQRGGFEGRGSFSRGSRFRGGHSRETGASGGDNGDIPMQEDSSETLQRVLGERYESSSKSLDLSNMYNDPAFKQSNIRVSMYDRTVVNRILDLIGQYCPDLLSLDLSNNRLQKLNLYTDLVTKCPELQTLNLSDNLIGYPRELENLSGLKKLATLSLHGNPVEGNEGDLRKIFPALTQLNGQQLSSPVKFDLPSTSGSLPSAKGSYYANEDVLKIISKFLEQYYQMYDSPTGSRGREQLLTAYSSDAVFSLSVCTDSPQCPGLKDYLERSRNLMRIRETSGKRLSLAKKGALDIVQFIRDLPATKHHPKSFVMDAVSSNQLQTTFIVNGLFSETDGRLSGNNPVIQFTRTFVITQVGNGIQITNDQLTLRGPTRQYVQSIVGTDSAEFSAQGPSSSGVVDEQMQAIQTLAAQTGMNMEYSKRCLEENGWDFDKAITVFTLLQGQQKIPQEAFVQ